MDIKPTYRGTPSILIISNESATAPVWGYMIRERKLHAIIETSPQNAIKRCEDWKTHSLYGPAPYDDTWAGQESNTFFSSGKSWYEVFWTPPAGNAYYNLAHQYMAAKLNILNGADPAAVQATLTSATTLFNLYTPAQVAALKGNSSIRKQFIDLATILDNYNNGYIGPEHCSE